MEDTNWYEETTAEASHSWYDLSKTQWLWNGTDEGNDKSYPGLVQGNIDNKNLKVCQQIIWIGIHQLKLE